MRQIRLVLAGVAAACALAATGPLSAPAGAYSVEAWGSNSFGQLGDGTNIYRATPVAVSEPGEVSAVDEGGWHSLALLSEGTVESWGRNEQGQLGDGTTKDSHIPIPVAGLNGVVSVAGGGDFSLALLNDGTVMAWGGNGFGELGDGTTTRRLAPVPVTGLTNVREIAAGSSFGMALLNDGTVETWGSNGNGELGDGTVSVSRSVPEPVPGLSHVVAISAGGDFAIVLMDDGTLKGWGDDYEGELGDGGGEKVASPVAAASGLSGVKAISAGWAHTLAALNDGTVRAWGNGREGRLGDGTTMTRKTPVTVPGLTSVTAVAAGERHSVALRSDGTIEAWGAGGQGQVGDGTLTTRLSPTPVARCAASEPVAITAGGSSSLALGTFAGFCPLTPAVTFVSPTSGPTAGGTTVTIWGHEFAGATDVRFAGTSAASFHVESNEKLTAVSPPGGSGPADITVVDAEGTSATGSADVFTYVPLPTVSSIEPSTGPPGGGTSVTITGTEFQTATAVQFGTRSAAGFTINSPTSITAVSPAGQGSGDVTVTNPSGTSPRTGADVFTYVAGEDEGPPEFGRCVKVAKGTGKFGSNCTTEVAGGSYVWSPGPGPKPKFTIASTTVTTLTDGVVSKAKITCTLANGTGEYDGTTRVRHVVITFRGCEAGGGKARSEGQPEGTVVTEGLQGRLGIVKSGETLQKNKIGLELFSEAAERLIAKFSVNGLVFVQVHGEVISLPFGINGMKLSTAVKFSESNGVQKPQAFEGWLPETLEATINGSTEGIGFASSLTIANEEKIEVNSVR